MSDFSIGDIAKQSGIPASTIRYYERIGLLPTAKRINGKRVYDETVLAQLSVIMLAKTMGFHIEEIQTLLHGFPATQPASERWQALAPNKLEIIDQQIRQLETMRYRLQQTLACDCHTLEQCAQVNPR
ncbi:MAG: MerR family transcriptional regulator [Chloroflexota bacterium]